MLSLKCVLDDQVLTHRHRPQNVVQISNPPQEELLPYSYVSIVSLLVHK